MAKRKTDPAVDEFVAEGKEIVERVSRNLQLVERETISPEQVGSIYRDMHTLKGSAQLFGFQSMGIVAHAMEASLDPIRKTSGTISPRLIEACMRNLDLLERMLKEIDDEGSDALLSEEATQRVCELVDATSHHFQAEVTLNRDVVFPSENLEKDSLVLQGTSSPRAPGAAPVIAKRVVEVVAPPTDPVVSFNESLKEGEVEVVEGGASSPGPVISAGQAESTIRVHVSLLDRILNLVGELVLVRNQLLQHRATREDDLDFMNTSKGLDVVTSELQGEVMKTRMQPIETVVGKFQRLVRDIAKDLNKKMDLTLEGAETELDKTLLEAVKDPLTHIVRNACDHGIESPEERKKAGKPDNGHLLIRSYHEGGQVVIEVSDDGRGLHRQKILDKAIEKGLVTREQAAKMQDRQICEIIFMPGFSTAQTVTSVSGRGVGMDVVKTNIEKIGGAVELASVQGKGTTIQLRIPLTLAIVPALLVKSGPNKFAIPQVKLVELVRVGGEGAAQIEYLQGRPMYRLRGSLLPLLDIREVTGQAPPGSCTDGNYLVVLNAEGECFGLIVGEILDTADIVVKPLSAFLKHLSVFSGATILGDGSIALILDVVGIAQVSKVQSKRTRTDDKDPHSRELKRVTSEIQEFLLFSLGTGAHHAVPLCLVHRLEEFNLDSIELSGEQRVTRYRGSLIPLLKLRDLLGYESPKDLGPPASGRISVIVVQRSGRSFGIEVEEILDVVSIEGQIDDAIRDRAGILGNLVHQESVIVVVDALGVVERFSEKISRGGAAARSATESDTAQAWSEIRSRTLEFKRRKIRVLYAEDVAFFRKHVSKVLDEAGIDVTTVEDGEKALEELQNAEKGQYNLVLSDIEMPKMTGLELVSAIRKTDKLKALPVIALTTRFRDKDIEDGKKAGFDAYLEKLNPEKLLKCIAELMGDTETTPESKEANLA